MPKSRSARFVRYLVCYHSHSPALVYTEFPPSPGHPVGVTLGRIPRISVQWPVGMAEWRERMLIVACICKCIIEGNYFLLACM